MSRLQGYINKLHAWRRGSGDRCLVSNHQARYILPPPPFLVFAIVEGLLSSTYAHATYVVPGEADAFCVVAAQTTSSVSDGKIMTLFSDDSDLLVYNMSIQTRILAFRNLVEVEEESGMKLIGLEFWPAQIARNASSRLTDLIQPAFFMSNDTDCSLDQACRMAAKINVADNAKIEKFACMFDIHAERAFWNQLVVDKKEAYHLTLRDSRVSELICQLESAHTIENELTMYLPILIEDSTKTSAWKHGIDIRALAYSVLLTIHNCGGPVYEYKRSGNNVAGMKIDGLDSQVLTERLDEISQELASFISRVSQKRANFNHVELWQDLIMFRTIRDLHQAGSKLPHPEHIVRVISDGILGSPWNVLHLSAQYQATYYSFRMMQQILASTSAAPVVPPTLKATLEKLRRTIEYLPGATEFCSLHIDIIQTAESRKWVNIIDELKMSSDQEAENETRDKDDIEPERADVEEQSSNKTLMTNPFALLAD